MNEKYFRIAGLSVGYHGKSIIHDIDLEIRRGDIVTLIGPNGSGKSTILKTITRQIGEIAGTVYLDGRNVKDYSYAGLSRKMAVLLTNRVRPELMTCRDVAAAGRFPYTGRLGVLSVEDDRKIDEAMAAAGVSEIAERNFNEISDGQRQRVLFARAICQEPEVLILDEPTSFLDIRYKLEMLMIIRNLAKERGMTVITSLHEIDLAQKISDQVICVKGDTIFYHGKPEEIFTEEAIRELYEIDNGTFDPLTGSVELKAPEGDPQVLVVSSGGTGIPLYRELQRKQIPFAAGILYSNDVDCVMAKRLASKVIEERPFREISAPVYQEAAETVRRVKKVFYTGAEIREINRRLRDLLVEAEVQGKLLPVPEKRQSCEQ